MNKYIRLVGSFVVAVLMLGLIMNVSASENTNERKIVVDENTTDEVLLEDKKVSDFAEVKIPSEKLTVTIENVEPTVEVIPVNNELVTLKIDSANIDQIAKIKETFRKISNASEFEVIVPSETQTKS